MTKLPDIEQVIKGLERHWLGMCINEKEKEELCPYWTYDDGCSKLLFAEALELLKYMRNRPENANRCVCCGEIIPEGRQVCPQCAK